MSVAEPELQEGDFAVLQHAVRLARDWQIRTVEGLKSALARQGYTAREITAAIDFWAHYEQTKPGADRNT